MITHYSRRTVSTMKSDILRRRTTNGRPYRIIVLYNALIVDELVFFVVPAVELSDVLANLLSRML